MVEDCHIALVSPITKADLATEDGSVRAPLPLDLTDPRRAECVDDEGDIRTSIAFRERFGGQAPHARPATKQRMIHETRRGFCREVVGQRSHDAYRGRLVGRGERQLKSPDASLATEIPNALHGHLGSDRPLPDLLCQRRERHSMLPQRGGRQPGFVSLTRDGAGVDPGAGDLHMPEPLVRRAMGGVEGDDRRQMGLLLIGQPLPATPIGQRPLARDRQLGALATLPVFLQPGVVPGFRDHPLVGTASLAAVNETGSPAGEMLVGADAECRRPQTGLRGQAEIGLVIMAPRLPGPIAFLGCHADPGQREIVGGGQRPRGRADQNAPGQYCEDRHPTHWASHGIHGIPPVIQESCDRRRASREPVTP